ncbi:MAG: thioredoxin family protein [Myxococcota bacterium]|nr:thioredoxin family protein [Myxococcota bacterium]
MDWNNIVFAFCMLAVGGFIGLQIWMRRRATALQGEPVPDIPGPLGDAVKGDALLFFHSPTCAPCRAMHPVVRELGAGDTRVHSVDVTRNMEAAQAFGLMGTPTVVAIRQGQVQRVQVGAMSASALREMLEEL